MDLYIDTDMGKQLATPTQVFQGIKSELTWPRNFELPDADAARALLKMYCPSVEEECLMVFFLNEQKDVLAFQTIFGRPWQLSLIRANEVMVRAECYGAQRIFFVRLSPKDMQESKWDDVMWRCLQRLAGSKLLVNFIALDLNVPCTESYELEAELSTPFYVRSGRTFQLADKFVVTQQATQLSMSRLERGQPLRNTGMFTDFVQRYVAPILCKGVHALLLDGNSDHLLHCWRAADRLGKVVENKQSILAPARQLEATHLVLVAMHADGKPCQISDRFVRPINQAMAPDLKKVTYVRASPAGAEIVDSFALS